MRVAFAIHRYGAEVIGGAEHLCRQVAEHMTRHWQVEVLTTCARSYLTWENEFEPGVYDLNGVTLRRFPVDRPRDQARQLALEPLVQPGTPHTREQELEWMRAQGPYSTPLLDYLADRRTEYDAFFFYTYLYATTCLGLPLVADRAVLVPTAHDEPWLGLGIIRELFTSPQGIVFLTPEERELVHSRFGNAALPSAIAGIGMDEPRDVSADRFRLRYGISGPFVLYLGRVDHFKGCSELLDFFTRGRFGHPTETTKLVLIGPQAMAIPQHPRIVALGTVEEQDKYDALAAADVLVQPSPFESLSIVLLEAWLAGTPVLVNGRCLVMKGQCRRAQGGLWYDDREGFDEALSYLLADPALRRRLAASGRTYVQKNYSWERVEATHQEFVAELIRLRSPAPASGERQP